LTPAEASTHPDRHQIYRALGTHQSTEVDIQPEHKVEGEEWFLLCSDGVTNMVSDTEIHDLVVAQPPKKACNALVALANGNGGSDNSTVIVVHVVVG
jgi:protein phosphatase